MQNTISNNLDDLSKNLFKDLLAYLKNNNSQFITQETNQNLKNAKIALLNYKHYIDSYLAETITPPPLVPIVPFNTPIQPKPLSFNPTSIKIELKSSTAGSLFGQGVSIQTPKTSVQKVPIPISALFPMLPSAAPPGEILGNSTGPLFGGKALFHEDNSEEDINQEACPHQQDTKNKSLYNYIGEYVLSKFPQKVRKQMITFISCDYDRPQCKVSEVYSMLQFFEILSKKINNPESIEHPSNPAFQKIGKMTYNFLTEERLQNIKLTINTLNQTGTLDLLTKRKIFRYTKAVIEIVKKYTTLTF